MENRKKEIEKIFIEIKNSVEWRKKILDNNIFVPHVLFKIKELNIKDKFYVSCYYLYDKNISTTDEEMIKMWLTNEQIKRIKRKLFKLWLIDKCKDRTYEELKIETLKLRKIWKNCDWCDEKCYILHQHHYPIAKNKGWKEIVNICPNCHYTFHSLEQKYY